MPNLTITADEEVLRWARVRAAEQNTSVAHLVGDILKRHMQSEKGYQAAQRRFLSVKARRLSEGPYPKRDELHDRARLR
jgi:plasmid stability protein